MNSCRPFLLTIITLGVCIPAVAELNLPKTKVGMETCMKAALANRDGEIVKLEFRDEKGVPTYEFDIRSADGGEVQPELDAATGKIVEDDQKEYYQVAKE